jgi:hypothetical protein
MDVNISSWVPALGVNAESAGLANGELLDESDLGLTALGEIDGVLTTAGSGLLSSLNTTANNDGEVGVDTS